MSDASTAIDKLQRIEELWERLKGIKTNAPEYAPLVKQVAVLSAEYQKLVEAAKTSNGVIDYGSQSAEIPALAGSFAGRNAGIQPRQIARKDSKG